MVELVEDGGFHTGDHTGVAGELHGNDKEEDVVAASSRLWNYFSVQGDENQETKSRGGQELYMFCQPLHWKLVAMNFRGACFGELSCSMSLSYFESPWRLDLGSASDSQEGTLASSSLKRWPQFAAALDLKCKTRLNPCDNLHARFPHV